MLIAQVLSGLLFLKQSLSACPPTLDTSQILLDQDGVAKIGGQFANLTLNLR